MYKLQLIGTVVLVATLLIVALQVAEGRRAAYATAFAAVAAILQDPEIRDARWHVLNVLGQHKDKDADGAEVEVPKKEFDCWSSVDRALAGKVCQSYDTAAIVCRRGMLPPDVVADSWGHSLRHVLPIVQPLIDEFQRDRAPEYWDDFVWIADLADRQPWLHRSWIGRARVKIGDLVGGETRLRKHL